MINLNDNEVIGMCSRGGLFFLQTKAEPSTTKFNQSKWRTLTLQRISEKSMTFWAGAGRSQTFCCRLEI